MKYLRVAWDHSRDDAPVGYRHELDAQRWDVRRVEIYRDGRRAYLSREDLEASDALELVQIPEIDDYVGPDLSAWEIAREAFEAVWSRRPLDAG